MKIVLTGATGFIGRRLFRQLQADGHDLHVLGRKTVYPEAPFTPWDAQQPSPPPPQVFDGAAAVVHLAGTPVAQRWTEEAKRRIRQSRIEGTRSLVEAMDSAPRPPAAFVCASAIGIYGSRGDEILTETSRPGSGFLAEVCQEWERAAEQAATFGVRVVKLRIGVVLGVDGGALPKMLPAFKAGAGGRLGSGKQWMSWIHIDDLLALIRFAIARPDLRGVVNATSPNPVTNSEFTSKLAGILHRPAILLVPAFALKAMLGEMSEVLLASQRVQPAAANEAGFQFAHPNLPAALRDLFPPR